LQGATDIFFRAVMSVAGNLSSTQLIWEKVFRIASQREVLLTSVVGLCGIGIFLGARQLLGITHYERQLIDLHGNYPSLMGMSDWCWIGDSEYIKNRISFVDVDAHRIRIFYAEHSLVTILPKPSPLIVCIHGLGGQINQFESLLKYFCQVADVLALDLPGCGGSPLTDRNWDKYTTESLVNLVHNILEDKIGNRKVVLMGHSLGTLIVGRLALELGEKCLASVLLCPKAEISKQERRGIQLMTTLPEFVFNIFRKRDRAYSGKRIV
jgi:predicted alpha/beta-fold hydrolase